MLGVRRWSRALACVAATLVAGSACVASTGGEADAQTAAPVYRDASHPVPARVSDLLSRMSLADKLGQMTQAERKVLTPSQLATYRIGSVLSGGGSAPSPNTPTAWADMTDAYQKAALSAPLGIPMLYGIDAVHGHNNVAGATIYPHNIGLGATRDPQLVQSIAGATAEELRATGIRWDFAPCVCVARNDRWGRTYESFGELPSLVSSMTSAITGLQGTTLGPTSVLATAKHYVGDGGTTGGVDQGDTQLSEAELRAIHLAPFKDAIAGGVGSVMASYSSWNGVKMHANKYLLTDVLKGELGFTGFVVSDWAAIDQIDGDSTSFTADEIRMAINAGIDMVMVPNDYQRFLTLLRGEVETGRISMSRIDDANRRILTKKFELGLFEHPYADRSLLSTVGGATHRALARRAVAASQVLLKNKWGLLPLPMTADKIFVAGKSADDVGNQSGGWTISWQGASGPVPGGTSILQAIRQTVSPATTVTYDRYGNGIDDSYNAAIAVVGETPYTEYYGDRPGSLDLDAEDLQTLAKLRASGTPVAVVLVSGRPLDIADQLSGWDALVASWLPGLEGQGVADVLFGATPATGRLPVTWPSSAGQEPINDGDGQTPLFAYGFGLRYAISQAAYDYIGAAYYDDQRGTHLQRCADTGCGQNVGWIGDGDYVAYKQVEFGTTPPALVETRVASGASASGTIEYRIDSATGPILARVVTSRTGGWQSWSTVTTPTAGVTGRHDVYVVFHTASGEDFINVNWFRFFD